MRFYVNLSDKAVTLSLYDKGNQPAGWLTKALGTDDVEICFHNDGTPTLLAAGIEVLFGCKAFDQFASPNYLTSVTGFTAPADPTTGFYGATLPTNTPAINTALGSSDAGVTPGSTPSIPTTSCEIDWWPNGPAAEPTKSQSFSVEIDNTPVRGGEIEPGTSTPYPAPTAVQTLLVPTAVKLTAYSAAPGDLVLVNASVTPVPITLPAAPGDKSQIAVKVVKIFPGNLVPVTCGGADVLDFAGGSTSISLSLAHEGIILQYAAATAVWTIIEHGYSLVSLDARYATAAQGALAVTAVQGTDSRLAVVTLEEFAPGGVLPVDCGALLQSVANTLGNGWGGIIQLRETQYNLLTKVSLPTGVHLRGANAGIKRRGTAAIQGIAEGPTNGTIINFAYPTGDSATAPAGMTLSNGSSLSDVSLYEANQATNGAWDPYCFAVRINGAGCYVGNVELVNNYRGIDVQSLRFRLENITGNPLALGIQVDNCEDYSEIYGVEFVPSWDPRGNVFQSGAVALSLGRADDIRIRDLRSFNYGTTLNLFRGTGGFGAYGTIDGLSSDTSTNCIVNQGTGARELLFTNARLICAGGPGSACYTTPSAGGSSVKFAAGYLASAAGNSSLVNLTSGGLEINGTTFANGSNQPCLTASASIVAVHNCTVYSDFSGVFAFSSSNIHGTCWGNRQLANLSTSGTGIPVAGATLAAGADVRLSEKGSGQLTKAGNQTISSTPTTVTWDTAGFVTPGVGIPASGPVPSVAGLYRITGGVAVVVPTGGVFAVYVLVNGVTSDTWYYANPLPGTGNVTMVVRGSSVLNLPAGASIGLQVAGPTSGTILGLTTPQTSITLEQV